ncbi:hypothetical protein [Acaryochloris marina]|uniref:Uncharacterized protein n=1 Tax=Acaryochloris marina (strain MBIC 11017) TaxID=329726 RepID=B0C2S8_ACAM1|nr:hypothetical protein [Acaryochloris marina]ABW30966.1 hypothetical protein AM1_6034 [Acaryochloris marina MBIC11017]
MFSQLPSLSVDQQHRSSLAPRGASTASSKHQHHGSGLRRVLLQASQKLSQRSQLSLEKKSNYKGEVWWQIADPCSGKSFYAQTLKEAIHWIEVQGLVK